MTTRLWLSAAILGIALSALFWVDPLFVPLVLVGPPVTGALAAVRGLPLRWIAVVWTVAGLGAVVSDFVVNREDVVFHLVLTIFVVALATGGWWIAARLGGRRAAPA